MVLAVHVKQRRFFSRLGSKYQEWRRSLRCPDVGIFRAHSFTPSFRPPLRNSHCLTNLHNTTYLYADSTNYRRLASRLKNPSPFQWCIIGTLAIFGPGSNHVPPRPDSFVVLHILHLGSNGGCVLLAIVYVVISQGTCRSTSVCYLAFIAVAENKTFAEPLAPKVNRPRDFVVPPTTPINLLSIFRRSSNPKHLTTKNTVQPQQRCVLSSPSQNLSTNMSGTVVDSVCVGDKAGAEPMPVEDVKGFNNVERKMIGRTDEV